MAGQNDSRRIAIGDSIMGAASAIGTKAGAVTKGTIYPIVKSISKWFGVKMTKEIFAGFFKKAIPVVGGVVGGGLTYATFKPRCTKLKAELEDTYLSNPNYREDESNVIEIIIKK